MPVGDVPLEAVPPRGLGDGSLVAAAIETSRGRSGGGHAMYGSVL